MLTLYYNPGACSLAPHIVLAESGAPYSLQRVSLADNAQLAPDYRAINPRGKVPALRTDAGILTENVAILTYLARIFPHLDMLPEAPMEMARCLSHMAWLSNTVHPAFTHERRPNRFATDPAAIANVQTTGRANAWTCLQEIDALLGAGPYVLGERYSIADPYTLVIYGWGKKNGLPVAELNNYTAFVTHLCGRPAIHKVLTHEQSVLLQN